MVAIFVASAVVTLLQFLRLRDRRLLPLMALFALLAAGSFRGIHDGWGRAFDYAAGVAGLALLVMLSPRHPASR